MGQNERKMAVASTAMCLVPPTISTCNSTRVTFPAGQNHHMPTTCLHQPNRSTGPLPAARNMERALRLRVPNSPHLAPLSIWTSRTARTTHPTPKSDESPYVQGLSKPIPVYFVLVVTVWHVRRFGGMPQRYNGDGSYFAGQLQRPSQSFSTVAVKLDATPNSS